MQKKRRFALPKAYQHIVAEALEGLKARKLSTSSELFVSEMIETDSTTMMIASSPVDSSLVVVDNFLSPDLVESIHERLLPSTGNEHSSIEVSSILEYNDEDENDDHASCVESSFLERKSNSLQFKPESCIPLQIPSYSIVNLSKNLVHLSLHVSNNMVDDRKIFIEDSTLTKGTFSRSLLQWCRQNSVTEAGRDDLLNLLQNSLGEKVNLPIRLLTKSTVDNRDKIVIFRGSNLKFDDNHDDEGHGSVCSSSEDESMAFQEDKIRDNDCSRSDDDEAWSSNAEEEEVHETSSNKSTPHMDDDESVSTCELSTETAVSIMDKYDVKTTRFVQIDQCINDCFVYAGDNSVLFSCPICKEIRFRPCTRAMCSGRGRSTSCEHLKTDGVAYKQMFYRPLLLLIVDLLKTPNFVTALNYERKSHTSETKQYADFMDGDVAVDHLSSMDDIFLDWKQGKEKRNDAVSVKLLLSEFYDGGQLFKNHVSNFWGLMIQILNLPPSYRGKLGIGMFVQAIYAGRHANAEKFLFTDNFVEELIELYHGVEIVISEVRYFIQARLVLHILDTRAAEPLLCLQSTSNSKAGCPICRGVTGVHDGRKCVYIGHRHLLSTEHYLRYLGQSGKCCPEDFYAPHSTHDIQLAESFLDNHTSFSSSDHTSCKAFENLINKEETKIRKELSRTGKTSTNRSIELKARATAWVAFKDGKHDFSFCEPCNMNPKKLEEIQRFLFLSPDGFKWSHQDEDFNFSGDKINDKRNGLRKFLFYRHFDFRPFKVHEKVPYETHLMDAVEARNMNANKKVKDFHVNGIHDVWSFDRLPYADISKQFTWPFVHSTTGVIKLLSKIITGQLSEVPVSSTGTNVAKDKFISKSSIIDKRIMAKENEDFVDEEVDEDTVFAKKAKRKKRINEVNTAFNSYRNVATTEKPPYEASKDDIKRCRDWFQCILLPSGLNDDSFQMTGFLLHDGKLGYMKMNQRIKLISSFWELMLLAMTGVADQYKLFYRMIGTDISRLMSLQFSSESIEQLNSDIIESMCLWEGLLPLKTCTFQLHELLDLAKSIPLFGPPMGVSEFPGERAIGAMINRKLHSNTGGISFEKKIIEDQINFEMSTMKSFYKSAINDGSYKKERGPNSSLRCKLNSQTGILQYDPIPFSVCHQEVLIDQKKETYGIRFNEFEMGYLVDTLVLEVEKQFGNFENCEANSSIYRIENKRNRDQYSAYQWLEYVANGGYFRGLKEEDKMVAKKLISFTPNFFKESYVYGVKFASRGIKFRETRMPQKSRYGAAVDEFVEGSAECMLSNAWKIPPHYGSWCRFEQESRAHKYGQINAFFRILVGDLSIDNLIVASITGRKYKTILKSSMHTVTCRGSLDIDTLFVATTDIYPTRIATVPFRKDKKVICLKKKKFASNCATSDASECEYLYMISLHTDKLSSRPVHRPFKDLQL